MSDAILWLEPLQHDFHLAVEEAGDGTVLDLGGKYTALTVQVTGTFVATITWKGSVDGSTYIELPARNRNSNAEATTATATGVYELNVTGLRKVMADITAYTSGAVTAKGIAVAVPMPVSAVNLAAGTNNIGDVDVLSIAAGDNNIGNVDIASASFEGSAGSAVPSKAVLVGGKDPSGKLREIRTDTNGFQRVKMSDGTNDMGINPWSDVTDALAPASMPRALWAIIGALEFDGTNYNRRRNNNEVTVYSSAARTATPTATDLTNYNHRGVVVVIDVTAITDTPSVTFTIEGKSTLGSDYYTILASAAITGTGVTVLRVYPGLTAVANQTANDIIPRLWRVTPVHADADSITYSVSANYVL